MALESVRPYRVWSVVKLKGGVGGTTSAVFVATALARVGHHVLVVDADKTAQSAVDWALRVQSSAQTDPPYDVAQWTPVRGMLSTFIGRAAEGYDGLRYVVVDVEPEADVVRQAAAVSDLVVMPIGVDLAELSRVVETDQIVNNARPGIPRVVLLTRVPQAGRGRSSDARKALRQNELPVLDAEVPQNRDIYADAFGQLVVDLGAYEQVTDELVDIAGNGGAHVNAA